MMDFDYPLSGAFGKLNDTLIEVLHHPSLGLLGRLSEELQILRPFLKCPLRFPSKGVKEKQVVEAGESNEGCNVERDDEAKGTRGDRWFDQLTARRSRF
jgi:hypothetical protein